MTLQNGTRLGPYEVIAPLGAGGMGEVWRARDTRLEREVALKVLPPHLSGDAGFKLRFEREARLISSLNHPNICTLHDVGESAGIGYLVMEYIEGESLAERLLRGPMPVDQVLRTAVEIAAALDRAHRGGVVHRDLKPGNVMLTKSGAKLLDFGLAKPTAAVTSGVTGAPMLSLGETEQRPLTAEGTIVGTFQYMAPEQVEGKEADPRTDIFAFGAIVYEMLTGKRAFEGKTKASLIASILDRQPPPVTEVRPLTPPALDRVVRTALEKDPDDRWQTAHDLLLELRWIAEAGSQAGVAAPVVARRRNRERLAWSFAALAFLAAITAGVLLYRAASKPLVSMRTEIPPPENAAFSFQDVEAASLAISPDGRRVVFTAVGEDKIHRLWVRSLETGLAKPIAGTDRGFCPFWSPDSRFVAFFAEGKLKKIEPDGGPALTISDTGTNPRSGSWSRDDVILFSPDSLSPIHRVAASGGKSQAVTKLDGARGETTHRWVTFLPDQQHFLYLAGSHSAATQSEAHSVYAGSLDGKTRRLVLHARSNVAFSDGHLLWLREAALIAQPFDLDALELRDKPQVVASGVRYATGYFFGSFSVADDGTLVYAGAINVRWPLAWFDRFGKKIARAADAEDWSALSIAPDGKRFAAAIVDPLIGTTDIWVYDATNGTRARLTESPRHEDSPVWSPDGRRVAYAYSREVNNWSEIRLKWVDGRAGEEVLIATDVTNFPMSWSADGRDLAFATRSGEGNLDVMLLAMDGTKKVTPLLTSDAAEGVFSFSPDGRWGIFTQDPGGKARQVYVTALPGARGRWQIGSQTLVGGFSEDGREILYLTDAGDLMEVDVVADGTSFHTGPPRLLAKWPALLTDVAALSKDAQRILMTDRPPNADSAPVRVITNWTAGLRADGQ